MEKRTLRPVAFFSRTLRKHERNYTTTNKELLAVVESIKKFRIYLQNPFTLITDHHAIRWLNTSLDPEKEHGRLGRWISYLQSYRFTVVHKPGVSGELSMADYLSRAHPGPITAAVSQVKVDGMATITSIFSREEFLNAQKKDKAIQEVTWALLANTEMVDDATQEAKQLWRQRQKLHVGTDGILRIWNYGGRSTKNSPLGKKSWQQAIIPASLCREFLKLVHDAPISGHLGRDRTLERVRQTAYWPSVAADVNSYCTGCPKCQLRKRPKHVRRAPLQATDIPKSPLSKISCDFVEPYPETPDGYKYVLQIQDILARYVMFIPTKDETAMSAAKALVQRWICVFDITQSLQSDNGTHFASTVLKTVCEQLGVKQVFSSPWHPQSQGQVERQNDTLNNCVAALVTDHPDTWPTMLPMVAYAFNSGTSTTTGMSPFELLFKQKPNRPESFLIPPEHKDDDNDDEDYRPNGPTEQEKLAKAVRANTKKWEKIVQKTRKKIKAAQDHQARKTTKRVHHRAYNLNDLVMKKSHLKGGGKLRNYHQGPYIVVGQTGPVTYQIREAGNASAKEESQHYNELLPWNRQRLQHEVNQENDEEEPLLEQPPAVQPTRRSTRSKRPTQFIQLQENQQSYQYKLPGDVPD